MSTPITVTVHNGRSEPVTVSWVDLDGNLKRYFDLSPGRSQRQETFIGHSWIAQSRGKSVAGYYAGSELPTWNVRALPRMLPASPDTTQSATFRIVNRLETHVSIYWIDHSGDLEFYATVHAGQQVTQRSFRGHRWAAVVDNEVVSQFGAGAGNTWSIGPNTSVVPVLSTGSNRQPNEGLTPRPMYQVARGALKAIMVFVDFPDVRGTDDTAKVGRELIGSSPDWFATESYRSMSLAVTQQAGWRRMPKASTSYDTNDFARHKAYISDALKLFPTVDFTSFHLVYVVSPEAATSIDTHAFTPNPGQGVPTRTGEVLHVVTFGHDTDDFTLVHETGHLFGLPDLYRYGASGDAQFTAVGAWDVMSDIFRGRNLLAWHRRKLEWLKDSRVVCHLSGPLVTTLAPVAGNRGTAAVVLPLGTPPQVSAVYVLEAAQPLNEGRLRNQGVLVYRVDARVATGADPVVVREGGTSNDSTKISTIGRKYAAPFAVGTTFRDAGERIAMKVLSGSGGSFTVLVTRG